MTTARERYEQKTKVVTFRVSLEVFAELEEIKAKGGLSYSDLIKLGAGIGKQERMAKLAQISGLEERLAELNTAVDQKEIELDRFLAEERARRLEELNREMEAFRLFNHGWSPEEAAEKLAIPQKTTARYYKEWGEEKENRQTFERYLVIKCLKKHIDKVQEQITWCRIIPTSQKHLPELEKQMASLQQLLRDPSKISQGDKRWLIAEYSSQV